MVSAKNNQLISSQGPQAKTNDKSKISGRMAFIGISDVVTASVYSKTTRMKKLMMMKMIIIIIIIIRINRKNNGFSRMPEIDFCYETKARKAMVDFKFDVLYS